LLALPSRARTDVVVRAIPIAVVLVWVRPVVLPEDVSGMMVGEIDLPFVYWEFHPLGCAPVDASLSDES
jgi:hypothetical protein